MAVPMTIVVRLDASIPSVTSLATGANPNPLVPSLNVTRERSPVI